MQRGHSTRHIIARMLCDGKDFIMAKNVFNTYYYIDLKKTTVRHSFNRTDRVSTRSKCEYTGMTTRSSKDILNKYV